MPQEHSIQLLRNILLSEFPTVSWFSDDMVLILKDLKQRQSLRKQLTSGGIHCRNGMRAVKLVDASGKTILLRILHNPPELKLVK